MITIRLIAMTNSRREAICTAGRPGTTAAANRVDSSRQPRHLQLRGSARPRKVKTLSNTINALFQNALPESELVALINELQKQALISIGDNNVSYSLPA